VYMFEDVSRPATDSGPNITTVSTKSEANRPIYSLQVHLLPLASTNLDAKKSPVPKYSPQTFLLTERLRAIRPCRTCVPDTRHAPSHEPMFGRKRLRDWPCREFEVETTHNAMARRSISRMNNTISRSEAPHGPQTPRPTCLHGAQFAIKSVAKVALLISTIARVVDLGRRRPPHVRTGG
jgi:hypothetical protein